MNACLDSFNTTGTSLVVQHDSLHQKTSRVQKWVFVTPASGWAFGSEPLITSAQLCWRLYPFDRKASIRNEWLFP